MYLRDFLALKPFHDYSLCSVCILPLIRNLQSAVHSLRFTLTNLKILRIDGIRDDK